MLEKQEKLNKFGVSLQIIEKILSHYKKINKIQVQMQIKALIYSPKTTKIQTSKQIEGLKNKNKKLTKYKK